MDECNQENLEEIFEMEELTEIEEKDLTGGASAGRGGYSTFRIRLPIKPYSLQHMSVKVDNRWSGKYTYCYDVLDNVIILKLFNRGERMYTTAEYTISYYGVDHISHNISGRVRFR